MNAGGCDWHAWTCATCGAGGDSGWLRKVMSDAEWHDTATGHDVTVAARDGSRFALTDDGWRDAPLTTRETR